MWRRCYASLFALLVFALAVAPADAQVQDPRDIDPQSLDELSRALQFVGETYADKYTQPITDAFGGGMHAGLFKTAAVGDGFLPGLPFNVYLGVSATGTLMAASDKRFTPPTDRVTTTITQNGQQVDRTLLIQVQGSQTAPAAFGSTDTPDGDLVVIDEDTRTEIARADLPPGLVDTPVAPLLIPELAVGSILGTDAQLRYLPKTRFKSYGTVGLLGVAVRHSLSQYIPLSPLSIAVQGSWQQLSLDVKSPEGVSSDDVGNIFDASGWAVNLQASKSLPIAPLTFYGGVQYEKFNVEYNYVFEPTGSGSLSGGPIGVSLDQTAANNVRGIVGFRLTAAFLQFNADYALASNDVFTFGMGVRL